MGDENCIFAICPPPPISEDFWRHPCANLSKFYHSCKISRLIFGGGGCDFLFLFTIKFFCSVSCTLEIEVLTSGTSSCLTEDSNLGLLAQQLKQ